MVIYMQSNKRDVVLFHHTHWDREWYRTFEGYRFRLGQTIKSIFNELKQSHIKTFLLDGQTVILQDYLELYPEDSTQLKELIASGSLQVGPWYVLIDEFLVSGESIIRNLQLGIEQARQFGQKNFIAYLPDMFGHIAQMPQILKNAGLEIALVWRGVNPSQSVFEWQALDHSSMKTIHLTKGYYQDSFHRMQESELQDWLMLIDEKTPDRLPVLLPCGGDHLGVLPEADNRIAAFNKQSSKFHLSNGSLLKYAERVRHLNIEFPVIKGELHNSSGAYVLPGTWSSRTYLKVLNVLCQYLIQYEIEPLMIWSMFSNRDYFSRFTNLAWELLLKNHPHDSICGCSIDLVHQEMLIRFSRVQQICNELKKDFSNHNLLSLPNQVWGKYIYISNFSSQDLYKAIEFEINCKNNRVKGLLLIDESGKEHQLEILRQEVTEVFIAEIEHSPHWEPLNKVTVLGQLPLTAMKLNRFEIKEIKHSSPKDTLYNKNSISNQYIKIVSDSNTIKIYSQLNDELMFENLEFIDGGDAGDEYNYSPPFNDLQASSTIKSHSIQSFALKSEMTIKYKIDIPLRLTKNRQSRLKKFKSHEITVTLTLFKNDPIVKFHVDLMNSSYDHRLQMVFKPTVSPQLWKGSTPFGYIERKMRFGHSYDVKPLEERLCETFPIEDWILTEHQTMNSLLFFKGLHEASIIPYDNQQALAITLIRGVNWLSRDDLRTRGGGAGPRMKTPEAQCLGEHTFNGGIACYPKKDNQLSSLLNQWRYEPFYLQGDIKNDFEQLFEFTNHHMMVSALKVSKTLDAVVLRCVNITEQQETLFLKYNFTCEKVTLSSVIEEDMEPDNRLHLQGQHLQVKCKPFEILTIKFYL